LVNSKQSTDDLTEEEHMHTAKQRLTQLVTGALIVTGSLFSASGVAAAVGQSTDPPGVPAPSLPNVPDNPIEEGVPVPIPGGGA
jgi:hypothetical protein